VATLGNRDHAGVVDAVIVGVQADVRERHAIAALEAVAQRTRQRDLARDRWPRCRRFGRLARDVAPWAATVGHRRGIAAYAVTAAIQGWSAETSTMRPAFVISRQIAIAT
jgi:hypothetical protein